MEGFFSPSELRQTRKPLSLVPRCGACGLYKTCQSPKMAPTGEGRRRVLLVGEAPGKNEDEQGRQFVGKAGKRLKDALSRCGVDMRRDCVVTNAVICRPKDNKLTDPNIPEYCRPTLVKTLEEVDPEIIIPLGAVAARSVLGHVWKEDEGGIEQWAGFRIPGQKPNAWICPTFHPSFVMRAEEDEHTPAPHVGVLFDRHIAAAFALSGRPWDVPPDYPSRVRIVLDTAEAARLVRQFAESMAIQAIDYETTTLKPTAPAAEIVTCAISDGKTAIAFPWEGDAVAAVEEWTRSPCPKVVSNMQFEENWTHKEFGHGVTNWTLDTMLCAHWWDNRPGITSIKFQVYAMLGVPIWNAHLETFLTSAGPSLPNRIKQISRRDLLRYNALDALYEVHVARRMLANYGLLELLE